MIGIAIVVKVESWFVLGVFHFGTHKAGCQRDPIWLDCCKTYAHFIPAFPLTWVVLSHAQASLAHWGLWRVSCVVLPWFDSWRGDTVAAHAVVCQQSGRGTTKCFPLCSKNNIHHLACKSITGRFKTTGKYKLINS